MPKKAVVIKNKLGLHARAASQIVNITNKYSSEVVMKKGSVTANGKSLLGILTLDAPIGSEVLFDVTGSDAQELLMKLIELVENKFGEQS